MTEPQLKQETLDLIKQVEDVQPGKVDIHYADGQVGFLRHDQAHIYFDGGNLRVDVLDMTNPDYTISHELIHFLLTNSDEIPQLQYDLQTGQSKLDMKLMATGMELYDIVLHFKVYEQQRQLGLVDDEVERLYYKGILEVLKPETDERDQWMSLRITTLLDAFVFFGDKIDVYLDDLQKRYPKTLKAAQDMYRLLTSKDLNGAFAVRRAIVKLWKQFDEQLEEWNMVALHLNDFATLTPVLSQRQQRLQVRQLFEIFHSDWTDINSGESGYIGRFKNDGQNSFVFGLGSNVQDKAKYFKQIYEMPVAQFLKQINSAYITR